MLLKLNSPKTCSQTEDKKRDPRTPPQSEYKRNPTYLDFKVLERQVYDNPKHLNVCIIILMSRHMVGGHFSKRK